MMKKHLFIFAIALVTGFGLVSCIENDVNEDSSVQGYRIDIPVQAVSTKAVADDGGKAVATYKTTENVYVYNATTSTIDDGVLHPTADATETTFSGTLNKTYSVGNTLKVLYNTNSQGVVDYSDQDGTIEGVKDAGMGEVTISSVSSGVITTNTAQLDNLQSIFRFTFKDKATSEDLGKNVRFVRIFSTGGYLQAQYDAVKNKAEYGPVTISREENLPNNFVYAGLRLDKHNDELVFQVITKGGKVYSGSKTAPSGGFDMGKFYKATVELDLYTFTVASDTKVYFSPGDLGLEIVNGESVYSFTEPFTDWGHGNTTNYNDATVAAKDVAKRVWFDFYFESGLASHDLYGIANWRIPKKVSSAVESYEWNYLVDSRTMNSGVERYYMVTIPGHQYCLLLPPDETKSSDIGSDLTSGSVSGNDYIKYLGKGFVLLFNTGRGIYSGSWSWGSSSSGFYWAVNDGSNRYYFTWPDASPKVDWGSNRMRNHIRYIHDANN